PPRIVEDDAAYRPLTVPDGEDDMVVGLELRARVVEYAGRRGGAVLLDAKRARHPEMADQCLAAFEMRDQVFGAAAERGDAPSRQRLDEPVGQGKAHGRAGGPL